MGIVDEDVARVRQSADIVGVVSAHTQLRRVGRRWQGLCPFHNEKSPSFSVNGEDGLYYCFGCGAKGDVITFVREIEHLDFVGAVEWLAGKAGISLRYTERDEGEARRRRAQLLDAVAAAAEWYHQRLLTGTDAGPARAYLRSRGFDKEMVARYQLGWAPAGWDEMCRSVRRGRDVMVASGLAIVNRRDRVQDFFRGRVLFPILDDQGRPVAFGGRILPGGEGPKYQNSRDNELYSKSRTLYGLSWAKADAVHAGEVVVCEGYTDVIGMHLAGVARAVATCGTSLTEDHVRLLRKYTRRLVLAYDADAAGQAAAERVHAWEVAHDLDVAVAALPAGVDPDDLARSDPGALAAAVEGALPFLEFRIERVLGGADLATAEGRARAADRALAIVREHPNPLVRDQYLMHLAGRTRVSEDVLRRRLTEPTPAPTEGERGRPSSGGRERPAAAPPEPPATPEVEALRVAVHRPHEVAHHLHAELFTGAVTRTAFTALAEAHDLHDAIEAAGHDDERAGALLARLAVEEPTADGGDVVARLVTEATRREVEEVAAQARGADDAAAARLLGELAWAKLRLEALVQAPPSGAELAQRAALDARPPAPEAHPADGSEALEQLLAWLLGRLGGTEPDLSSPSPEHEADEHEAG